MVRGRNQSLQGVEAVIDKDYASSCLAIEIDADVLFKELIGMSDNEFDDLVEKKIIY